MNIRDNLPKLLVAASLLGGLVILASKVMEDPAGATVVDVKVPALSPQAVRGKRHFDETCVACHGENASGTDQGPPLVHDIYNPGHHSDPAFFLAAKRGVRGHHWPYGDMPPQPHVSPAQMADIVRYVRELQMANGIGYRPHRM